MYIPCAQPDAHRCFLSSAFNIFPGKPSLPWDFPFSVPITFPPLLTEAWSNLSNWAELLSFPSYVFYNSMKSFSLYCQAFFSFHFSSGKRRCTDFPRGNHDDHAKLSQKTTHFFMKEEHQRDLVVHLTATTASAAQTQRLNTPTA